MKTKDSSFAQEAYKINPDYPEEDKVTVEGNLGLARLCASRFKGRGIEYEELYSAGCMGLVKAARSFEPERGVRFSTYAVPVILGEIRRLFRDGGSVKVSRMIKERSLMVSRLMAAYESENGEKPTVEELCRMSGLEKSEVIEALCVSSPTVSLTHDDDDGSVQLDLPVEAPDVKITNSIALEQVLSELDERDRELIKCRFYLNLTQQKTAERLGCTQVQVSRREKKLLLYMRSKLG